MNVLNIKSPDIVKTRPNTPNPSKYNNFLSSTIKAHSQIVPRSRWRVSFWHPVKTDISARNDCELQEKVKVIHLFTKKNSPFNND